MTPEQNLQLLAAMDAHRRFILLAHLENPRLLCTADERLRELIEHLQKYLAESGAH